MACEVKGGLYASVHEMRADVETKGYDDTWVAVSVDARNAFNLILRAAILDGTLAVCFDALSEYPLGDA